MLRCTYWEPENLKKHLAGTAITPSQPPRASAVFFTAEFLPFSRAISTFSSQFGPSFMSCSPIVLMWGEEKRNVFECWFSSVVRPFVWPRRQRKGKRWRGAGEVINCFLSLKRNGKKGWLWGLVNLLLHSFRCTDTIREAYKNTFFHLQYQVILERYMDMSMFCTNSSLLALSHYQCSLCGNSETEVFIQWIMVNNKVTCRHGQFSTVYVIHHLCFS